VRKIYARKASRLLVSLFLLLGLAVSVWGADFQYWWPWIYARCTTNGVGIDAWAWVVANSNYINYMYGQTNCWDHACLWVSTHSNAVQYMEGQSNLWDDVSFYVSAKSNSWDDATDWVAANSNSVAYMATRTNDWDYIASYGITGGTLVASSAWNSVIADGFWTICYPTNVSAFTNDAGYSTGGAGSDILVRAYNALQSIPATTYTTINFSGEDFDTGADFNLTTDTFTVPETGYYYFTLQANIQSLDANENFRLRVWANGLTEISQSIYISGNANENPSITTSGLYYLSASDTVIAQAYHSHASALNLTSGKFMMWKVGS